MLQCVCKLGNCYHVEFQYPDEEDIERSFDIPTISDDNRNLMNPLMMMTIDDGKVITESFELHSDKTITNSSQAPSLNSGSSLVLQKPLLMIES